MERIPPLASLPGRSGRLLALGPRPKSLAPAGEPAGGEEAPWAPSRSATNRPLRPGSWPGAAGWVAELRWPRCPRPPPACPAGTHDYGLARRPHGEAPPLASLSGKSGRLRAWGPLRSSSAPAGKPAGGGGAWRAPATSADNHPLRPGKLAGGDLRAPLRACKLGFLFRCRLRYEYGREFAWVAGLTE